MALAKATTNKKRRTDNVNIPAPMAPNRQITSTVYDDLYIHLLPGNTLYNPCFPSIGKIFSKSTLYYEPLTMLWAGFVWRQHGSVINDD